MMKVSCQMNSTGCSWLFVSSWSLLTQRSWLSHYLSFLVEPSFSGSLLIFNFQFSLWCCHPQSTTSVNIPLTLPTLEIVLALKSQIYVSIFLVHLLSPTSTDISLAANLAGSPFEPSLLPGSSSLSLLLTHRWKD